MPNDQLNPKIDFCSFRQVIWLLTPCFKLLNFYMYFVYCQRWLQQHNGILTIMLPVLPTTGETTVMIRSHICSTSSQYSLFIRRYSCSATFIIHTKNNWLLLSLCFILSLESNPSISTSTSFCYQFLHFRLTYSFTHHFFLF